MMKIIYWGSPQFAVPGFTRLHQAGLIAAVVTQPDKPFGRGQSAMQPTAIRAAAEAAGVAVLTPATLRSEEFKHMVQEYLPATFLIVAYGKIIPQEILDLSELPAINIHPSLLPELRGPSPIQTALLEGRTMTGLTLMQLDAEMDHGPILAQKKVTIVPQDTYETLSEKLSFMTAQFLERMVPRYLNSDLKAQPQDHARATYCSIITTEDGRLDFSQDAQVVWNKIRALNPAPGTYFEWNHKRIRIVSAKIVSETKPASQFSKLDNGRLGIACGSGMIEVLTLQMEGKKPVNATDFLNGYPTILTQS